MLDFEVKYLSLSLYEASRCKILKWKGKSELIRIFILFLVYTSTAEIVLSITLKTLIVIIFVFMFLKQCYYRTILFIFILVNNALNSVYCAKEEAI